jgi:hypothetical protein
MSEMSIGRLLSLATAVAVLAVVSAAGAGVGGGTAPRILDVVYYEELKDMRHVIVVDVKGKDPVVFATADGKEYDGELAANIHDGPGVKAFVIRNRQYLRGVREDFEGDDTAKVKVFAGNSGGLARKKCKLHLLHDPDRGFYATGKCTSF